MRLHEKIANRLEGRGDSHRSPRQFTPSTDSGPAVSGKSLVRRVVGGSGDVFAPERETPESSTGARPNDQLLFLGIVSMTHDRVSLTEFRPLVAKLNVKHNDLRIWRLPRRLGQP